MLKRNATFLTACLLLLCLTGWVLLNYDKAQVHLWMNTYHTPLLDSFFRYYTAVGEWIPYVIVVLLLFYKAGWAAYLASCLLVSGLLSQVLKHLFNADRPYKYFADHLPDIQLPLVDGVPVYSHLSFPSGHTTTFFALFLCMSIVATDYFCHTYRLDRPSAHNNTMGTLSIAVASITCFLLAVIGAYSRIYLSQHFLADISGGMVLGVITTLLLYIPVPRLQSARFWDWHFGKNNNS